MPSTILQNLRADQRGATAIEYGLIAALIVLAAVTGIASLGRDVNAHYTAIEEAIENANE